MEIFLNTILTAVALGVVLWISKKNPVLAGFIASMPLSTVIILALGKLKNNDPASLTALAKSIFVGIPASLMFFIPFLLADRLKLTYWQTYFSGLGCLVISFFVHRYVIGLLMR